MRESATPLVITLPAEPGIVCKVVGMEPGSIKAIARNFLFRCAPGDEVQASYEFHNLRNLKGDGRQVSIFAC